MFVTGDEAGEVVVVVDESVVHILSLTVDKTSVDQTLKRRCVKHENDHIKYFYDS